MKSACCSAPFFLYLRSTARVYLAIVVAFSPCPILTSGSLVNLPIKITLFICFLLSLVENFYYLVKKAAAQKEMGAAVIENIIKSMKKSEYINPIITHLVLTPCQP